MKLHLFLSALLALTLVPMSQAQEQDAEASATDDNRIKRIWSREIKKKGHATMRTMGDLVLSDELLQFEAAHKKKSFSIRLDDIHTLSYGKLAQDVDTEWIVMALEEHAGGRLMGFRDGRKFGYGTKTEEIYETLRAMMESMGKAQYDVPEGFRVYDELGKQFTLAYPADWHSYHQSVIEADEDLILGSLIFSETEFPHDGDAMNEAIRAFENGNMQGFAIERERAADGMRCAGISDRQRENLLQRVAQDGLLLGDNTVIQEPHPSVLPIDRCDGLRITAQSRRPDGSLASLDYRIVSDGGVAHLLIRRSSGSDSEGAAIFETIVENFRLSAARPRR